MKSRVILLAIALVALLSTGCDKLKSRDKLNRGVQAYKSGRYADAVVFFKGAVDLDPENVNGRLYLATAYMTQYIPGADSPDNNKLAQSAKDEFQRVLEKHPTDPTALASLASLAYQQAQGIPDLDAKYKKLDESKEWYTKLVQADPKNKEAWYSLGVIDWLKWYGNLLTARAKLGMKPDDPGPLKDKKVREELKEKWATTIAEAKADLQKALDIDKDYDDAMAYMNLMIRYSADLVDSSAEYDKQVELANQWVQKALDTKKAKAAKAAKTTGGITQEQK